jgi:hypothetical protein
VPFKEGEMRVQKKFISRNGIHSVILPLIAVMLRDFGTSLSMSTWTEDTPARGALINLQVGRRVKERTPTKTGEKHIRVGLEAHLMKTHTNVVTATDLVLVEEAMTKITEVSLEAHRMKRHTSVVTATDLVLVEEVMTKITEIVTMKEEVQDMIKKVGSMVILGRVLLMLG